MCWLADVPNRVPNSTARSAVVEVEVEVEVEIFHRYYPVLWLLGAALLVSLVVLLATWWSGSALWAWWLLLGTALLVTL